MLNFEHSVLIVVGNEVDSKSEVAEPTRSANSMQVSLCSLRIVKVDNDVDSLDIDTPREDVRTD